MSGFEEGHVAFNSPRLLAKIFRHGGSQAVRLPKAFRFDSDCVTVRREGSSVILEPTAPETPRSPTEWKAFCARIDGLSGVSFRIGSNSWLKSVTLELEPLARHQRLHRTPA